MNNGKEMCDLHLKLRTTQGQVALLCSNALLITASYQVCNSFQQWFSCEASLLSVTANAPFGCACSSFIAERQQLVAALKIIFFYQFCFHRVRCVTER